ncbi:MAG: hypothetical protein R3200_14810 [Xanthomonadales bacterium]|nr:hypothetical protein [Xanthomonadales bacterium]
MIPRRPFAYAQARMQAGLGFGPDRRFWDRLVGIRDPQLALRAAADVAFWQELLRSFSLASDIHTLERAFRAFLREKIQVLAGWVPPAWNAPVEFTARLIDIPVLEHLAQGGRPYSWMEQDPVYAGVAAAAPEDEPERLSLEAWDRTWWCTMPATPATMRAALKQFEGRFLEHLRDPSSLGQSDLREDARRLFRRYAGTPVAPFAWLTLVAVDLWRLRGELMDRFLFERGDS